MIFDFGPYRLDTTQRILLHHGKEVSLPKKEFDLLQKFVENSGKLLRRAELNGVLWPDGGGYVDDKENSLDKYISNLRTKLEKDTGGRPLFETKHKVGFRFLIQVDEVNDPTPKDRFGWPDDKTLGFVGREYIFTAIDGFIKNRANGYFMIEGDPGVGKTTILAEFVRRTGCIAFFNMRSMGINRADQFLESVCLQLISKYHLPYNSLPSHATQDDGNFLSTLLKEICSSQGRKEKIVIAVDALDEVDFSSQSVRSNILYLPYSLPEEVYFVVTRRRQLHLPFTSKAPQKVIDLLKDYPVESRRDIKTYIQNAITRPQLRTWLDGIGVSDVKFVETLAEKSESNFMYLYYVLPEIEHGTYSNLNLEKLPIGLEGYYMDHWRVMGMMDRPLKRSKIKILYVLAEVVEPVSRRLIADLTNEDGLIVQETLDEWTQFLHEVPVDTTKRYSVYHTSFRDFLHRQDILQAAEVTIPDIHGLIADNLWNKMYG